MRTIYQFQNLVTIVKGQDLNLFICEESFVLKLNCVPAIIFPNVCLKSVKSELLFEQPSGRWETKNECRIKFFRNRKQHIYAQHNFSAKYLCQELITEQQLKNASHLA